MDSLHWSLPEYEEKNRSIDWFWGLGLLALLVIGAAIYFQNYLFAILIAVSAFSLGMFAFQKPKNVEYELNEQGIRIHQTLYPYQTLESFWVETRSRPKIILLSKKFFVPYIVVPIVDHDPKLVRLFLLKHLSEVEHHEPFINHLIERLGL